jgi:hypothetical protein
MTFFGIGLKFGTMVLIKVLWRYFYFFQKKTNEIQF